MTKQPKPEMASQSRPGPGYVVPGLRALASTAELPEVPKNMHQVVSFSQCVCVCVRGVLQISNNIYWSPVHYTKKVYLLSYSI